MIAEVRRAMRGVIEIGGLGIALCAAACSGPEDVALPPPSVIPNGPCGLPGSVIWETAGPTRVPGGPKNGPDISWMKLPVGFCAHVYATVPHVRQVKVAPSGELFAASPSQATAGGGSGGLGAIAVLPDDNHDGASDGVLRFVDHVAETQGMAFSPDGSFYYQDAAAVMRVPYHPGDRAPSSPGAMMIDMAAVVPDQPTLHWPKAMDVADDGSLYVMNGGEQGDTCESPLPVRGAIVHIASPATSPAATVIARGFRNPIAVRCNPGKGHCFALELAKDGSGDEGGREKLVPIRDGANDDWGFPCCATRGVPYPDDPGPAPDCSGVTDETVGFVIGNTPFGLEFAPSSWPAPFQSAAIVALHGRVGTYAGARVIAIPTDPTTGEPIKTSNLPGGGGFLELASGWDDGRQDRGRPAAVGFAADGRLFLGDDIAGLIVWIAPITL